MKISTFSDVAQHGSPWSIGLRLYAQDGTKLDLTSGAFTCQVRSNARPAATPLTTATPTVADSTDNLLVLGLSAYKMSLLQTSGSRFWDAREVAVELDFTPTYDPLNPRRVAEGELLVSPGGNTVTFDPAAPDPTTALNWITLTVSGVSGVAMAMVDTMGHSSIPIGAIARGQYLMRSATGPDQIVGTDELIETRILDGGTVGMDLTGADVLDGGTLETDFTGANILDGGTI
jgi:hypothetical protein